MANIQILKYEFIQNNTYGTYVAGDVIDVYLDTDLVIPSLLGFEGVSATINGVAIPQYDPVFIDVSPSIIVTTNYNQQICAGTTKVIVEKVEYFAPYANYSTVLNNYECVVNPPTCDLIIVGIPTVTGSSDDVTADGSFTVSATSTNPIQYKIGGDFIYDDGTSDPSGFFAGLLAGSYRVFVRDSTNCGANVLVTIPIANNFGERFKMQYTDLKGWVTTLSITKRDYSGSVYETCGTGSPFNISIRGEGSSNKFEPILSVEGVLELLSETDSFFQEIYTNDPNLYRLSFSKDFGSGDQLLWLGKVFPQQYQEAYIKAPYGTTIVASDTLADLKNFFLIQGDGQAYFGTVKLIKLVSYCLSTLRLELPIRVACNLYSVDMAQTDNDDPFDLSYIDYEAFYIANDTPDLDFVMRSILEPFGARLIQWEGRWNIVRVEELVDSYDYRDFDKDGEYVGFGTYNPLKDIDFPINNNDLILVDNNTSFEVKPGFGKIKVNYHLGLKENVLKNGNFRLTYTPIPGFAGYIIAIDKTGWLLVNGGYALSESFESIGENNVAYTITAGVDMYDDGLTDAGNAYLQSDTYSVRMGANNQLKISVRFKINLSAGIPFGSTSFIPQSPPPYYKLRLMVRYGGLYLNANGSWSSDVNIVSIYLTDFNVYNTVDLIANQPTSGLVGTDFDVKVYHSFPFHADYFSQGDLEAVDTYDTGLATDIIPTGYKTEISVTTTVTNLSYFELQENTDTPVAMKIIRPHDYNAGTNPRQWVLQSKISIGNYLQSTFKMAIDFISVQYLTDGKSPYDTIIRTAAAEPVNKQVEERDLIIGSSGDLITTEASFGLGGFSFSTGAAAGASLTLVTTNILDYNLIYTGFLRDVDGVGYEFWKRDGIAESDKLHGIWLKMMSSQYKKSWRLFRGTFRSNSSFFGFLDICREVNDSNRLYLPMALTLDDLRCKYSFELLELKNIREGAGSDGSGEAPFSSGFTIGFGASGFN